MGDTTKKKTGQSAHPDRTYPTRSESSQPPAQDRALFQSLHDETEHLDLASLKVRLEQLEGIPKDRIEAAFAHVTHHLQHLGLDQPSPSLVVQWIGEILRQHGIHTEILAHEMLRFSLQNVEQYIKTPMGSPSRGIQNPETTSHQLAEKVKSQFACRKVYSTDVVNAHEAGDLELIHLGDVDRPHDVFVTPDYIKIHGLPASQWSPESGPPKHPNVLLAQMVRMTRELQRNFSGDIQWGYVNTLLLPFTENLSDEDLGQFVQQLVFEFSQIDPTPGHTGQRVILDMDLDMPRYLGGVAAVGYGGRIQSRIMSSYKNELKRFNEVLLDILNRGDFKTSPFHAPRLMYHLNDAQNPWSSLHQTLFEIAIRFGNPGVSLSFSDRHFGALGRRTFNDPDLMQQLSQPHTLRGFSTNSVALNLPRLLLKHPKSEFSNQLNRLLDLCLAAHRQKRMFISRLMASGPQGPLRLLRHRNRGRPFLKLDWATQPIEVIGLGEAARLLTGSPKSPAAPRAVQAGNILRALRNQLEFRNRQHKLRLVLSDTQSESVAYRFANLDLRAYGQKHSNYILQRLDQTTPIYTSGTNILVFDSLDWRSRFLLEGRLHEAFDGSVELSLFSGSDPLGDPAICQRIYREATQTGIKVLRFAPDLKLCRECHLVFHDAQAQSTCPNCSAVSTTDYGYCVSDFSPVDTWCRGMRGAWNIRHRWDTPDDQTQTQLPL